MSLLTQGGATHSVAGPSGTTGNDETDLDVVEESLMQLTMEVPLTRDKEILVRMRLHTSGGRSRFARLFREVTRAIVCYSKHHHDE